jgi:hypothetical protein
MLEDQQLKLVYYEEIPSYKSFLENHLRPNLPCIFGSALVAEWQAVRDWVDNGSPNWKFFAEKFGSDEVSVADCTTTEFGDQCRETTTVSELISKWMDAERKEETDHHYLKDWHLRLRHPEYDFYRTPEIFRDDWMNDYYINSRENGGGLDDFRFVYMGVAGTFTPLHRDVYCSYSWSTNVVGYKKWTLFPPAVTPYIYANKGRGTSKERVFDVRKYDRNRFPEFEKALSEAMVVVQKPQESIFVPSGWHHQVENLTDCISINHNWANGNSIKNMYRSMCEEIVEVENALSDVRQLMEENWKTGERDDIDGWQKEWVGVVQDVLIKNSGWGWLDFWKIVLHAARTRFWHDSDELKGCEEPHLVGWRSAPVSLRPPWREESAVMRESLESFTNQRQEAQWMPDVFDVIEELSALLEMHPAPAASEEQEESGHT